MAVVVIKSDDLSGAAKASTVQFGFDGVSYEIDLTDGNKRALAKSLSKYITKGRVIPPRNAPVYKSNEASAAIRKWGQKNGYHVAPRGRIASGVIQAYFDAQEVDSQV